MVQVRKRPDSPPEIVVRLVSQRGMLDEGALSRRMPGNCLSQNGIRFTVHDEATHDVVVVMNYSRYDATFVAKKGFVWVWHNEPIVRQPFPKGFDRVFTHVTDSNDPRVINAPPLLDWWVDKSFEELYELDPPEKTKQLSAIASTKTDIEGHRLRNSFVNWLEEKQSAIDVYGLGREHQLVDKWQGLADYRFSVAIENTSKPHYWTEKISDCFLAYTVPVYFGATNIGNYFPSDSFVSLPLSDMSEAKEKVLDVLSDDSWEKRLPALREARDLVLNEYSLFGQLTRRVRDEAEIIHSRTATSIPVHGRRIRRGGWIRGIGLIGNLRALWQKRRTRVRNHS